MDSESSSGTKKIHRSHSHSPFLLLVESYAILCFGTIVWENLHLEINKINNMHITQTEEDDIAQNS